MKATKILLVSIATLAVISLACNFITGGSSSANPTAILIPTVPAIAESQPTQPPAGEPTSTAAVEPTAELASGSTPEAQPTKPSPGKSGGSGDAPTRDLNSVSNGLDTLDSYRVVMVTTYSGTDTDNKAQTSTTNLLQEYIRASGDSHMKIDSTDTSSPDQNSSFEMITVGGVSYILSTVDGTAQCVSFSGGETPTQNPLTTEDIFGSLTNLKLVQKGEKINGIMTNHYTFDEKSFPSNDFESAKGNVWVAQDGDFVVKMDGSGTGNITFTWQGTGTTTWDYQLQDVNAISSLVIPATCTTSNATSDIPIPANATNKTTFDTMTTFESPDSPADVAKYYQDALTAAGWKETNKSELAGMHLLTYTKDGKELNVTITPGTSGSGSSVLIILAP